MCIRDRPSAKHGFFAVRLQDAQDAVEKLPWVERAEVRKRWPDVMDIEVVEHKPFARWGADRLLSVHGKLFPNPKGPVSYTHLDVYKRQTWGCPISRWSRW